jgi:cytochrome c oxidase subunit III
MARADSGLADQFTDLQRQRDASELGMWTFLITEIMFFGGLILAYVVCRTLHVDDFAEASRHTNTLLGTLNTAILLTSSFTMALAVKAAREGVRRFNVRWLLMTALFGVAFLIIKACEYGEEIKAGLFPGASSVLLNQPHIELFFYLYFIMTGLHALHVLGGIAVLVFMAAFVSRPRFSSSASTAIALTGLYWHFVDIVWIFLFPLLYLIQRHG